MHISLDERQLERLETIISKLIQSFNELAASIEKITKEIKTLKP